MYVKLLSAESVGFLVICNVEHHWKKKKKTILKELEQGQDLIHHVTHRVTHAYVV